MKGLFIAILVCISPAGFSQAYTNIVPDSSFEFLNPGCGTVYGFNHIDQASPYWRAGNNGTSDFYYGCYFGPPFNTYMNDYPNNVGGSQYPRTGNAFAGIFGVYTPARNLNYREYLQTSLLMPLEAGKKYIAGCYVNMGENYKRYSVNNIGMLLTDTIPTYDSIEMGGQWYQQGPIRQEAQIMNDTTVNLMDTSGWILVADTFIAQGGEQWLTIGNFRDDAHSVIVPTNYNCNVNDSSSYYYVDDVFLYCIDTACATVPAVGIKEQKHQESLIIFPNPADNKITIEFSSLSSIPVPISIIDLLGIEVKHTAITRSEPEIDIADLKNGMYYLIIGATATAPVQLITIER